jgi:hypothetical protein
VSHRLVAAQIRSSPSAKHRELGEDLSLLKTIEEHDRAFAPIVRRFSRGCAAPQRPPTVTAVTHKSEMS